MQLWPQTHLFLPYPSLSQALVDALLLHEIVFAMLFPANKNKNAFRDLCQYVQYHVFDLYLARRA